MPVLEQVNDQSAERQNELMVALLAEWRHPSDAPGSEPLIVMQSAALDEPAKHIYVVWSAWEDLTPLQRSHVILRAYKQYLGAGSSATSHLTLISGLLPDEVQHLRINQ